MDATKTPTPDQLRDAAKSLRGVEICYIWTVFVTCNRVETLHIGFRPLLLCARLVATDATHRSAKLVLVLQDKAGSNHLILYLMKKIFS